MTAGIYATALEWCDVTSLIVDHLTDALPDVTVGSRVPDPLPLPFVRVQRVGGVRDIAFDRARVLVECWGDGDPEAAALCGEVRDLLRRMRGDIDGWAVSSTEEIGGPGHLADPDTATPRVLLTVTVTVRANPADPAAS